MILHDDPTTVKRTIDPWDVEADPGLWPPDVDNWFWVPDPPDHTAADERWWSSRPSEGGCGPDELSPEERAFWAVGVTPLAHFLDETAGCYEAMDRYEAGLI